MSSSVEERIVAMKFDNAAFERGVQTTLASLQKLKNGLKFEGGAKGLTDLNAAGSKVQLGHIASGIQSISDKFKAMSVIGVTALATIANKATQAGLAFTKSLTLGPVTAGLHEYETKLNSIQTILANTAHEGTNLKQVTASLNELNHYSDQTIYNFGEMARNIGTFTAAGVSLDKSTAAIKGIANLAAVSGSNAQQASTAMYQLSQSLAAGKVSLEDWNSVVNAGMGGKVFQDALMETARVHGVAVDKIVKDAGSFRNSLEKGWITGNILTETLSKFTGDLSAAQLKTMGYNEKQIAGILKMAKVAKDAATKVKTFSQLVDTLQEAAGSGWAQTWELIFGNFDEARNLWTGVNNVLGGMIQNSANARNKMIGDWKALGGRTVLIEGVKNAFQALLSITKPIGEAFRQIFPATTGKQLYAMTVAFRNFTAGLKIGAETADRLKRTFAGVFAVFGIGIDIIQAVLGMFFNLFGQVGKGSGGFLKTTASIGDFLVALRKAIHDGDILGRFFGTLGKILAIPIKVLQALGSLLGSVFDGFDSGGAASGLAKKFEPMATLGHILASVWSKVISILDDVWGVFEPLAGKFSEFFSSFGSVLSEAIQGLDFGDVLGALNTGLFAGLVLLVKQLFGKLKGDLDGAGIIEAITGPFTQLTDTLKAMQNTLRAATLLEIAAAIGIMAAAVSVLSKIDSEGLTRALTAMSVMFVQLMASLLVFEKLGGTKGFLKMPFVATSMILLGVAINILAAAVKSLSDLDWEGLAKGLVGVGGLLASLALFTKFAEAGKTGAIQGVGLILLATGIKILASAMKDLSGLGWEEIAKGLVAMAGGLTIMVAALNFIPPTAALGAAGVLILALSLGMVAKALDSLGQMSWGEIGKGLTALLGALTIITAALFVIPPTAALGAAGVYIVALSLKRVADVLQTLGDMKWGEIGKGLTALLGAMTIITAALFVIPPTAPLGAAGILIVAFSLGMVADVLQDLAQMGWEEIAKGLVAMAGALAIIAVATIAMTGSLAGAAAILVVAASLAIMAPILQSFSQMSWEEIGKGLLMLAGVFVVLGAAGLLLTPVIPSLILLGVAVTLLGVGMLLAGAGVLAFSIALTALAVSGAAGAAAIVGIVKTLIGIVPLVMSQIGLGVIAFAKTISTAGPAFTAAITTVLLALIKAIDTVAPKIIATLAKLLTLMLTTLLKYQPKLVDTGFKLLIGVLNGISRNIGKVVSTATSVVVNFLNAVARNQPKVIQAGVNLILKFVNGLASAVRANSPAMGRAGANLATAIIEGMIRGLASGVGAIASKAASVARSALDAAKGVLGISSPSKEFIKIGKYMNDGLVKGLHGSKSQVDSAFNSLKSQLSGLMKSSAKDIDQAEAKLKRLTHARHKDAKAIRKARIELYQARKEHKVSSQAYSLLTKHMNDERTALGKLATKHADVANKLKAANDKLAEATKTRDDYNATVKTQFSDLPTIDSGTRLPNFVKSLKKQIADTQTFATVVQKLRDLGLNDQVYKELITSGTQSLPFVNQLLASGKDGVAQVNQLGAQLESVAGSLGNTASKALYQAAVDSAAGLVKGLQNQQKAIEKQMDKIADAMIKALKKKLKIKSPSQEFAKIGAFSAEGLAKGFAAASGGAEKSAENLGKATLEALRKSISSGSNVALNGMDINPTIKPVLDLTDVKKNAGQIGSMLSGGQISVDGSFSKAKVVADAYQENLNAAFEQALTKRESADITFNQTNNSPKALPPAEIYRQTKNQLSKAKEALT